MNDARLYPNIVYYRLKKIMRASLLLSIVFSLTYLAVMFGRCDFLRCYPLLATNEVKAAFPTRLYKRRKMVT